jgi:hypothetical protein
MNYADKLKRLKDRRQGFYSRDGTYNATGAIVAELLNELRTEKFEKLSEPVSVKYAVGAMQAVDTDYTAKSYEEGNRIRERLREGFANTNIPVAFEYQGSVPLDVHVRGNSDVDLLLLHDGFVTADAALWAPPSSYTPIPGTAVSSLQQLRSEAIEILDRRYPEAKVDRTGSKAITISGGSLKRSVDVVPAHWHDSVLWKHMNDLQYRDVYILDSKEQIRLNNKPFKHIHEVKTRCMKFNGALRKAVRLLKNVRYDSSKKIKLSSYDITSLAWHMSDASLTIPYGLDLLLVERVREHLMRLVAFPVSSKTLLVPDGSRKILDTDDKYDELLKLYSEIEQLSKDIASELDPLAEIYKKSRNTVLSHPIYFPS